MTDKPKAAHFAAFHDGVRLPHNSPTGLTARWTVANQCVEQGIDDMLHLSVGDRMMIVTLCNDFNRSHAVQVQLDYVNEPNCPEGPNDD